MTDRIRDGQELLHSKEETMEGTNWDEVCEGHPGPGWLVATENGLGSLTAWAAGTDNVRKMAVDDSGRTVSAECHDPDGAIRAWVEPFSDADREVVDEFTNSYLADAGVPTPPRGWVWLIRRPAIVEDDRQLWGHLNRRIAEQASRAPHPSEVAPILQSTMAELYASSKKAD